MMDYINILYSSHSGDIVGGGEKGLLLIFKELYKENFNLFLISPFEGSFTEEAKKFGVDI